MKNKVFKNKTWWLFLEALIAKFPKLLQSDLLKTVQLFDRKKTCVLSDLTLSGNF